MTVQVNTDNHIKGSQNMEAYFTEKIEIGLKHFSDHITRVEVHLSDQNGEKGGMADIQCRIEARLEGQHPILAESKEENHEKALSKAIGKIQAALRTKIGKMQSNR